MRTIEEVTKSIADYWIYNLSNGEIKTADDECDYLKRLLNEILEIHRAEKRPEGKWLSKDGKTQCNCCRRIYNCIKYDGIYNEKFCPNCGVDMRESEEK